MRGMDQTGVKVNVKAVWGIDNKRTQIFTYSDDTVSRLIAGYDTTKPGTYAEMFTLKLINAEDCENLQLKAVIMSEIGVAIPVK